MKTQYKALWLTVYDKEMHDKSCSYWYAVTEASLGHTAFRTKQGLMRFLQERNLKLSEPLTGRGVYSSQKLIGGYCEEMHLDEKEFYSLSHVLMTKALSNGDYTLALITEDQDGLRTVHTLNPNVKTRPVFDYFISNDEMN
jgi:hypothetical protein